MSATRYASVLGLGFGDCGKGHFVDALTRQWQAHTVVRFNGGAQAGHNVIDAANTNARPIGRHHTFSQFGAGTFMPGVRTLLVDPMVIHPSALLVEAQALGHVGVNDALSRLAIDAQCRVTTPYHQAAGRLRERLRGASPHGTCGVGVGETVRHALAHPGLVLRYGDLLQVGAMQTKRQLEKLQAIRATLASDFAASSSCGARALVDAEWSALQDDGLAKTWLTSARALARQCPPQPAHEISRYLHQAGSVVFEGAQGVLLDEWRGFHPHTTWSSISTAAVTDVAARFGITTPIDHYGVLRSYLTRHGAGPLPTHDAALDHLPEPHNHNEGWQGRFRRGHPDAVLLRYALEAVGALSGLFVSHLDVFVRGVALQWCERYRVLPPVAATPHGDSVDRLALTPEPDLAHQARLTELLLSAQPQYAPEPVHSAPGLLERIASVTDVPVVMCSYGPAYEDVRAERI